MFIVYPSRKQESYDEARVALKLNNHHGRQQGRHFAYKPKETGVAQQITTTAMESAKTGT
jgi:hypothetical protein